MHRKIIIIGILIIFLLSIVMLCLNFSKEEYDDDLAKETPWNQLSNIYKFNVIEFINNTYYYGESILNNNVLDKLLSEEEIESYNDDVGEYKSNCKIYSLKKINENYAIAIQFDRESNYYLYVNNKYEINTLKDLIETIDFKDNSNINTISYNYFDEKKSKVKNKSLSQKKIKIDDLYSSIFNKNLNLPFENSQQKIYNEYFKYEVVIDINMTNLNQNILLKMTDSGYIIFNICGFQYAFYIGEKEVFDFVDCFFNN